MLDDALRPVLGTAKFSTRRIEIYKNLYEHQERFTIAHEIGHFVLGHEKFIASETVIKSDLFIGIKSGASGELERLEHQANLFASELLLPHAKFLFESKRMMHRLEIRNRGFGEIYVDNQYCNIHSYMKLLEGLSGVFSVSKKAIEIRLRSLGLLVDERTGARSNISRR